MSLPQSPKPAKLVIGMLTSRKHLGNSVVAALENHFGSADMISPWYPFDFTDYYSREMGTPLSRRVVAFKKLVDQGRLADIKLVTNEIEQQHQDGKNRMVNIDPGILVRERFVLATGKNFTHRIYIGRKIYADLTLTFQKGEFATLPWTYPDYASANMIEFLGRVRNKYLADLGVPSKLS